MAAPAILFTATTVGVVAADVTPNSNGSTGSIIFGAIAAVVVAAIGAGAQLWINRRRNQGDPQLTIEARVAVLESNVADIQRTVHAIEDHVRPWESGREGRHR